MPTCVEFLHVTLPLHVELGQVLARMCSILVCPPLFACLLAAGATVWASIIVGALLDAYRVMLDAYRVRAEPRGFIPLPKPPSPPSPPSPPGLRFIVFFLVIRRDSIATRPSTMTPRNRRAVRLRA